MIQTFSLDQIVTGLLQFAIKFSTDLNAEFLDEGCLPKSKDDDVLMTARYKKYQLSAIFDMFRQMANEYRHTTDKNRAPPEYNTLLVKIRELCTKLYSIRLKYKVTKTAASPSKDRDADCMVKLQKLTAKKLFDSLTFCLTF